MEKVTIVGAGIGGLTLAVALQKRGIDFEIYESFSEFKDLGAGIMLANNAMQVFNELDINGEIEKNGYPFKALNITNKDLSVLSNIATDEFSKIKVPSFAIHRSELQRILLNQLPEVKINLGKKLNSLSKSDNGYELIFEDGSRANALVLIGADGIHSKVRDEINIKVEKRDANQVCWRGVIDFKLPEKYGCELYEMWGEGNRFGFVQIGINKVYWYALKTSLEKETLSKEDLKKIFKNYHPIVNNIISKTNEGVIITNKIMDIKPIDNWIKGKVCLIGDAAHATTPNMGQGACQSIEDALVLARELSERQKVEAAFQKYQEYRIIKANKVISTSWSVGKVSHYKNPISVGLRNFMMKNIPKSMMKKQNEFLYEI